MEMPQEAGETALAVGQPGELYEERFTACYDASHRAGPQAECRPRCAWPRPPHKLRPIKPRSRRSWTACWRRSPSCCALSATAAAS
eukprot:1838276-Prymnesium_polylepis.1